MKFEKFIKMIGPYGTILKNGGENWIMSMNCIMKCPEYTRPIGSEVLEMPEKIRDVIECCDFGEEVQLIKAFLPDADGKTSELVRVFEDYEGGKIGILNKMYGLIEKHDALSTAYIDDEVVALLVEDHTGVVGAFINGDYLRGEN